MLAKCDGLAYLISEDERRAVKTRHAASEFRGYSFRQFVNRLTGNDGINLLRLNSARFERCFQFLIHNHPFVQSIKERVLLNLCSVESRGRGTRLNLDTAPTLPPDRQCPLHRWSQRRCPSGLAARGATACRRMACCQRLPDTSVQRSLGLPNSLPSISSRRLRLNLNFHVKDCLGIVAVRTHQDLLSLRADNERTADALAALPRTVG